MRRGKLENGFIDLTLDANPLITLTKNMNPIALVEEISKWKLEAKLEDGDRYFYFVKEAGDVLSGKKAYVIGRKGTGKAVPFLNFNILPEALI
jgi:hypothetical protein